MNMNENDAATLLYVNIMPRLTRRKAIDLNDHSIALH